MTGSFGGIIFDPFTEGSHGVPKGLVGPSIKETTVMLPQCMEGFTI